MKVCLLDADTSPTYAVLAITFLPENEVLFTRGSSHDLFATVTRGNIRSLFFRSTV